MIKQIKINKKENFFTNDFFQNTKKIENLVFFNNFFNTLPKTVMEMVSVLVIVCFSLLLILYNKPDAYVISVVSLLVASGARFIPAFNLITQSFSKTRWLQPSFDLITKEMRNYIQINEENKYLTKDDNFTFEKEISFKNFTFGYNERNILDGINFEIKKGSCIGIIGESGEGKSTLVNLIMGLLKTEKNNVYIDGKSIEKNIYNWQQNIGYIPQDVYLMDASIKDNIAFGIEEKLIDEKRIEELIDQLNLRKFVDSFPKKLNENVGNMAVKISGGQKQRLGIARALYINPKVLIFDEATSSLDIDNENKIIEIIKRYKKNKTIILVSHRSNTLKYCDKIYEIKKGTISEKKIRIVTFYLSNNIGALLQAKSLRQVIEENTNNYNVNFYDYMPKELVFHEIYKPLKTFNISKLCKNICKNLKIKKWRDKNFFPKANSKLVESDLYIFGSDEIWNFDNKYFGYDPVYFGNVNSSKPKISYAASIGNAEISGLKSEIFNKIKENLKNFQI